MDYDHRKLEALLKWYKQEIGKALIAALIVKNDGLIVEKLTRYTIEDENEKLIDSISEIIQVIIERIEQDFRLGSFGAGTFDTAQFRFIFCKAGPNYVLITILNPLSMVDHLIPYSYLTAEKIARIFDGRPVSPVIPKLIIDKKEQKIQRLIGTFQKIKVPSAEYAYKVILVGDGAVGKTSMVHRFVEGSFQKDYKATIGTSIMKKMSYFEGLQSSVRLIIWDLAGQQQFMRVRQTYLTNAEAGILVYDVTRRESFINIRNWMKELEGADLKEATLLLVGNKIDLIDKREVSRKEGEELAKELNVSFIETSAKTGEHIKDAFRIMALQMIKGHFDVEEFKVTKLSELTEPLPKLKPIIAPKPIRFLKTPEPAEPEQLASVKEDDEILTYIQQKRFNFWKNLLTKILETNVRIPQLKEGLAFTYIIADDWAGIELDFCHTNREKNQKRFKILESYKEDIQDRLGDFSWYISDELEWDFKEQRNLQRLLIRFKDYGINSDKHWDKIQYKMIDGMKALVITIQNFIENLYPNF